VAQFVAAMLLVLTRQVSSREAARYACDVFLMALLCLGLLPHALHVFAQRSQWLLVVDNTRITGKSLIDILHGGWYVLPVIALQSISWLLYGKEKSSSNHAKEIVGLA